MVHETIEMNLPPAVIGRMEVQQINREITGLDEFLSQAAIRQPGTPMNLPHTSKLLEEIARQHKLNLLIDTERHQLMSFIEKLMMEAPIVHISFGAEPSAAFLHKFILWLRKEIHPLLLVQIGLQPTLVAGCTILTANKYFDFSLRHHFEERREELVKLLGV